MQPHYAKISSLKNVLSSLSEIIIPQYTLFSLPMTLIGGILAVHTTHVELPGVMHWVKLSLAVISARTLGMIFNRLIDEKIDRLNPRTSRRSLPTGKISRQTVFMAMSFFLWVYLSMAWAISPACFLLASFSLTLFIIYPYCKRFTSLRHFILGFIHALGPMAGSLALTNQITPSCMLLSGATFCWMSSRDLIYSTQDAEFQRQYRLYGIPVFFQPNEVIYLAISLQIMNLSLIIWAYSLAHVSLISYVGAFFIFCSFSYQFHLLRKLEIKESQEQLFLIDNCTSPILLLFLFFGMWGN